METFVYSKKILGRFIDSIGIASTGEKINRSCEWAEPLRISVWILLISLILKSCNLLLFSITSSTDGNIVPLHQHR